jgi:hypothetical protein
MNAVALLKTNMYRSTQEDRYVFPVLKIPDHRWVPVILVLVIAFWKTTMATVDVLHVLQVPFQRQALCIFTDALAGLTINMVKVAHVLPVLQVPER